MGQSDEDLRARLDELRQTVHDYRNAHGIREEMQPIDWTGAFWKRQL